jgi:hypothetical protein
MWSDKNHWMGLYTGANGTNSQTVAINPETLVRYKLLEVGLQIVHGRDSLDLGDRLACSRGGMRQPLRSRRVGS